MKLKFPEKINRRAVKNIFEKVYGETWEYLFDHEKENGLAACRTTPEWGVKKAWYATTPLKAWLIDQGYYSPSEFQEDGWPISDADERPAFPQALRRTWIAA